MSIRLDTLPGLIGPIARELLGEPNKRMSKRDELRFGNHGSLAVDLNKGTFFDHEQQQGGGVLDLITRETGLRGPERETWLSEHFPDAIDTTRKGNGKRNGKTGDLGTPVAHYDYLDESGSLLFQVVRFEPKTFRQRRRARAGDDPAKIHDGWVWTARDVRHVPYHLPELIEALAAERLVFVVEGEKDVDNLARIGAPATCNAGGTGKWSAELNHFFDGAEVVVIADNDPQAKKPDGSLRFHPDGRPVYPGQDHARAVAAQLADLAQEVRYLDLKTAWPDCPRKGDISDWIAAGGTIEQLYDIAGEAPLWAPDLPGPEVERPELPRVSVIDLIIWDGQPVPERRWLVRNRIPARNITLLSGDGGVGKTLLMQQLAVATVLGKDWLGELPEPGPVMLISAEDDDDEIHFRLAAIVRHYNAGFRDLAELSVISLAGKDAALACVTNHSIVKPTPLWEAICLEARRRRPRWIGIDTAADVFLVEERDRAQARQCVSLLRGLAMEIDCSIVLLSHPSLSGMASGSGMSGSTAWNNSVRSRLYLYTPKNSEADDVVDKDVRVLETMKANYAAGGDQLRLYWRDGLLHLVPGQIAPATAYDRAISERDANTVFLSLLEFRNKNDIPVSATEGARNYAPTVFSKMAETEPLHVHQRARMVILRNAMNALIRSGEIRPGTGPLSQYKSKRYPCLYIKRLHPEEDPQGKLSI